ncbi:amino acid adenylation domain-containing protein [Sabulilitoribacter arenilitoris]|uniref:Amino acid adenylation domain-containing protein n=1 Tax=Wocania arenilitoris TaxID=2044858 RepID=A0AAE3EP91_9FLAO|nr:amino acid adenylation domain-containing protein [Wocania arenilitoris]MCF7568037.1 amino acid adenylation domain-containing protein [Wocania arenilitoris]
MNQPESIYSLTQSQTSIWFGQKLNPKSPLYNVPYAFYIKGEIDEGVFIKAFQEMIKKTNALKTVFVEKEGIPYQKFLEHLDYHIKVIDATNDKLDDFTISDWLQQRSELTFDLNKPLFDSVLIKQEQDVYIWYLNVHHLITDASSSVILFNRLSDIYGELKDTGFTEQKVYSYVDYLAYEKKERERNLDIRDYWDKKVENLKKVPSLYGVKKRNRFTTKSNRVVLTLDSKQTELIHNIANDDDIKSWNKELTLFNIFSTLLFVYLYRVSGQKKLAIGAPIHNRIKNTFKNTAGLFIEIFPLVAEISDADTFNSILKRIKNETNTYLKYAVTGTASATVSRSFNTIFNFINVGFQDFYGFKSNAEWIHPNHNDPAHQIRCHIYDMNDTGELKVVFDINEDVLKVDNVNNITIHFSKIINAFLNNINQPIGLDSMLAPSEKKYYLPQNLEATKSYQSILELFELQASKTPNAIALQCGNETLTFNGLNKKANQLANYLIDAYKIGFGDKVALYNYRSTEYIISLLAVIKTGAAFIPIDANQPKNRVVFMLSNSNASLVIINNNLKSNIEAINYKVFCYNDLEVLLKNQSTKNINRPLRQNYLAYLLYTSGSTGNPKGVLVSQGALSNYLLWAKDYYSITSKSVMPLFTSIGFDLTITSTLLPFISGGRLVVYKESPFGPDMSLFQALGDNYINTIKLTPSHLSFLNDRDLVNSNIHTIIVGGEDFKVALSISIKKAFGNSVQIFNEYGPTEATVGCIVSEFNPAIHKDSSVPIGKPITNMHAYILDEYKNLVPKGVIGTLYLSGSSLANGYLGLNELTKEKFIDNPFVKGLKMYNTGDLARINENGEYEYLGRVDEQVKLRGYRIELTDIESNLNNITGIENCAVVLAESAKIKVAEEDVINCTDCGLPSNYPNTDFDEHGVCHLCNAFKGYKKKVEKYFKTEEELKTILTKNKGENPTYDCLSLLSGGKDSTYILAQLVGMGLKVLAFTLDNGYISEQAIDNVKRIVNKLGVDHVFGTTEHMNEIFIDSLNRHQNVCNGCFKTIYTLSTKIALEKQIPYIVTGLSRGQFFETRLTEELFWDEELDVKKIDDTILEVRKLYHREEDAVKELLDVSIFEEDEVFDKVQFVDFYRYSDVSLEDMLTYLDEKVGWVRPTDTGRSTNCLINQVGIYVHKKEKGYSNYSFPYSWDVRLGHKTRDESLEEINEYIDEVEVKRIMDEIGYEESDAFDNDEKLVAYYTGDASISVKDIKKQLSKQLPDYMLPSNFKHLDEMPLTKNGKIDKKTLRSFNTEQIELETAYVAPRNEVDELIDGVWKEVLRLKKIGINDNFIALGGHSLAAIRVTSRLNEELDMEIPLNKVFNLPTIKEYSDYLEQIILESLG